MKYIRKRGDTSNILQIFIQDSSSSTGAGLTGLTNLSGSLVAYYHRDVDTTATAISLQTMTVGTFTSAGFKEIDSANMPGWYQFCPPDAALASTSTPHSVAIHLKGATNMAPLPIEIQLIAADVEDGVHFGLTALPNAAAAASGGLPTFGTSSGQITASSGQVTVGTNNDKTGYTASTVSDKTGYSLTQTFPSNFSSFAITAGGAVTVNNVSSIKKNTGLSKFMFLMTDSTDHLTPKTGLTITATRSIDGGAFGSCTNSASELSNGWYVIDLAAGDLNGNVIALKFASTGADTSNILITTNA